MWIFNERVERQIQNALERGDLADLPGQGRPLALDDDSGVPENLRLAWRILKNAGYIPEGISLRREIADIEAHISQSEPGTQERILSQRRLIGLRLRLEACGHGAGLLSEASAYREKVLGRLRAGNGRR